ncbi:MAG: hypothetical protein KKF50_03920 [Nanoarchaeota archaeon]|nr:hypothetical protein [Nanoarchaeota archaeon]
MIGDNFDNMEKVVATPYPNKEVKVLSLEQLPKSYGFYDDEKIRVDRDMNKRYGGKIRVDFIENSKRTGFIKFKEGGEGYVYFDRLLTEAKL